MEDLRSAEGFRGDRQKWHVYGQPPTPPPQAGHPRNHPALTPPRPTVVPLPAIGAGARCYRSRAAMERRCPLVSASPVAPILPGGNRRPAPRGPPKWCPAGAVFRRAARETRALQIRSGPRDRPGKPGLSRPQPHGRARPPRSALITYADGTQVIGKTVIGAAPDLFEAEARRAHRAARRVLKWATLSGLGAA
jgi:hypothetical protein